jgi:hypothetical protein
MLIHLFTRPEHKLINIDEKDIKKMDRGVKKLVKENNKYAIPASGLNSLDIMYYLNHSSKPNLKIYNLL